MRLGGHNTCAPRAPQHKSGPLAVPLNGLDLHQSDSFEVFPGVVLEFAIPKLSLA
jgi:hypothetical protein